MRDRTIVVNFSDVPCFDGPVSGCPTPLLRRVLRPGPLDEVRSDPDGIERVRIELLIREKGY
jgi:hypothetical protein